MVARAPKLRLLVPLLEAGLDRPSEFARLTPRTGPAMVDFAGPAPVKAINSPGSKNKVWGSPGAAFGHAGTRESSHWQVFAVAVHPCLKGTARSCHAHSVIHMRSWLPLNKMHAGMQQHCLVWMTALHCSLVPKSDGVDATSLAGLNIPDEVAMGKCMQNADNDVALADQFCE